jgi:uncharacterized alkaline shock family protein YloU
VARREKERLCPKVVVLPQDSHFAILVFPFKLNCSYNARVNHSARQDFTTDRISFQEGLLILQKRAEKMTENNTPIGNIYISHRAIATVASQTALESYGVVGLAAKNLAEGIAQVLVKDPMMGIDVQYDGNTILIDLYIVIEYGTNIKMVASSVADSVKFMVERTIGLPVTNVNVHVRGLRISNPD